MQFMHDAVSGRIVLAACLLLAVALGGCKQAPELPSVLSPYKIDVQQGNVVTQEMVSKLKAGMTRSQVRFVLGSPLVVDPFRGDRWDYVSTYQKQGREVERRRVTVIFDDDKLVRIEGDVALGDGAVTSPASAEKSPANTVDGTKPPAAAGKPEPTAAPAAAKPATVPATEVKTEAKKGEPAKAEAPKDKPKQPGFFDRMLDKLGI